MAASSTAGSASSASTARPAATETSPLLAKSASTSFAVNDEIIERGSVDSYEGYGTEDGDKGREVEVYKPGKSSFGQTLLNILGDLIGTGLLACPIAIAHAGWIFGPVTLVLIGGFTLWTLKILLRIIEQDRRMRNFTDIIGYALGPVGERWVTTIFLLEICAWIVALVVLFSDSMEAVFPQYTSNQWKFIGMIIVVPTSFMPLRYLSFSSGIGITATWTLVVILISSGITTEHAPGSLRDPAPTDLFPSHGWVKFGTVLGLLISGFGGHGLIPNLVHDMKNPRQADRACEVAYLISMIVYLLVAICGYIMYGTSVSDEVSKDLARTPGFSPVVNKIAVLMVAINPLTKVPLGLRPLADMFFTKFNLHPTTLIPESAPTPRYVTRPPSIASETSTCPPSPITRSDVIPIEVEIAHYRNERNKAILRPIVRVAMAILAILGGVLMPSFESVLSFLGGGLGVVSTVIIPVWAGANVFGWTKWDKGVVAVSAVLAVVGTVCSFWPDNSAHS